MKIRRLNWAGIEVTAGGTTIVIDPFIHVNSEFFGVPREPFVDLVPTEQVQAVFVTHLHSDHFDPSAIADTYGSDVPVYVPSDAMQQAQNSGLTRVMGVKVGETVDLNSLSATASHAVDGLGDPQVSWIIRGDHRTVIHGGDTLWHGYWWSMAKAYGPFDVAFLPVNAPVVQESGMAPSGEPICMTPEQAVSAAFVLGARQLVPIHFGAFHNPPVYVETGRELERLEAAAKEKGVSLQVRRHGENVWLEDAVNA